MYAITGANGHLGRLVLKHLLSQVPANQIIATSRDPGKLEDIASLGVIVRRADFAEPSTLMAAYAGATSLLIISTFVAGKTFELHKAAISAAGSAGVSHLVYTSTPNAEPKSGNPLLADHGKTEVALAESGIRWTALRNGYYSEFLKNFLDFLLVKNRFLLPEGLSRHPWISREDCARAAAGALLGKLKTAGTIDVTGPEALSFADLASRMVSLSEHQIAAQTLTDSEIIAEVVKKGVTAEVAASTMRLISWISRESAVSPTDAVELASGIKPEPVDVVLGELVRTKREEIRNLGRG